MYTDVLNIVLAFLEGFALIISPCILPILPIILSASLTGDRRRPIGIVIGFIASFTIVTLFIRFLTQILHINPIALRNVSLLILLLLGLLMMSDFLSEKLNLSTQKLLAAPTNNKLTNRSDFFGGIFFGLLIGIIWTPCAGPILAAVIVQVVLQNTTFMSFLSVFMFAVGVAVPMLIIAILGRSVMTYFAPFRKHAHLIRKILGAIIVLSAILLYFDPTFGVGVLTRTKEGEITRNRLINPLMMPYAAPQIEGITAWINSPPLTMQQLQGKVVLIDFWTYSCINCIRTLPYIKKWYAEYHKDGLEVIGIHTPEFAFEHDLSNVKNAVKEYGILYPVGLDNNYVTWRNYSNRYWPAHYLIDKAGNVVYVHFGEGEYDTTENNIRYLLGLNQETVQKESEARNFLQTPETYLGYARMQNFASPESVDNDKVKSYRLPISLYANQWALEGDWLINSEKIISKSSNAKLRLHFNAKEVFAVMGVSGAPVPIVVQFKNLKDSSTKSKEITVDKHLLYQLIKLDAETDGYLDIVVSQPGLEVYAFTFG